MSGSGGGGGPIIPDELLALVPFGAKVQRLGIVGAIMSIVIPALVSMFILTPLQYGIGFIEWAGAIVTDVFGIVETQVATAFEPVTTTIVGSDGSTGVIDMVYGSVEAGLMDAGLGAPFAATLTVVVFATVLTVLIYVVIRVSLDTVPGLGGLNP